MRSKKEHILEIATKLFSEKGFEKTSVATICEAANVSKGLVYHHFKSKDEILIAIFERSTKEMVGLSNQEIKKNPRKKLIEIIEAVFYQLKTDKQLFKLNLNIMFQPSTRSILEKQIKKRATQLFNVVKDIFTEIDEQKSELLTYVFISEIDGIALNYLSSFEEYPMQEMKNQLIKKYKNDSKI